MRRQRLAKGSDDDRTELVELEPSGAIPGRSPARARPRAWRSAHQRNPGDGENVTRNRAHVPSKPGLRRKAPGLFCCPRQDIGDDAHCASSRMPRWRNRHTHASQKRATPGSNPGWGTRVCSRSFVSPAPAQRPGERGLLFDNSDVAQLRPRGQAAARDEAWMTHVQTWLNGQSATLPASRRGFETCCLHQILFPSSKGEDRGPSSRVCRFESGRELHGDVAQSRERLPCKQEGVGWTPTVSTNSL